MPIVSFILLGLISYENFSYVCLFLLPLIKILEKGKNFVEFVRWRIGTHGGGAHRVLLLLLLGPLRLYDYYIHLLYCSFKYC